MSRQYCPGTTVVSQPAPYQRQILLGQAGAEENYFKTRVLDLDK